MELIKHTLDILNIFKKLNIVEKMDTNNQEHIIELSNKCKTDIQNILNKRKLDELQYYING